MLDHQVAEYLKNLKSQFDKERRSADKERTRLQERITELEIQIKSPNSTLPWMITN